MGGKHLYHWERCQKKKKHTICDFFSSSYSSSLRTATVLPHHTNVHTKTRLMSLLFVWKDRGGQTCLYPLAQPTEEATTVDNAGPQFGGAVPTPHPTRGPQGSSHLEKFTFLEGKTRALLRFSAGTHHPRNSKRS